MRIESKQFDVILIERGQNTMISWVCFFSTKNCDSVWVKSKYENYIEDNNFSSIPFVDVFYQNISVTNNEEMADVRHKLIPCVQT